jgi:glycosyltransferase involved in cell wall biosynthesis
MTATTGSTPRVEISVVVPVFDEVESLPALHRELTDALERLGRSYELLFVDDGSRDGLKLVVFGNEYF